MVFYSEDVFITVELRTKDFLLRPLRATDVKLDYAAVMESKDLLRLWSQSGWPTDDFTLADNLKELQQCFTVEIPNKVVDLLRAINRHGFEAQAEIAV